MTSTEAIKQIVKVSPEEGSIIVFKGKISDADFQKIILEMNKIESLASRKLLVLNLGTLDSISQISEKQMADLGWIRKIKEG